MRESEEEIQERFEHVLFFFFRFWISEVSCFVCKNWKGASSIGKSKLENENSDLL